MNNSFEDNQPDLSAYQFPHLNDTQFPLLDNVDVYKYENEFDYKRWTDNTKIHLCNVLWNNDYVNVVKFKDDKTRDAYFDNKEAYEVELNTAFHVAPDGAIKVPIPYPVASRYNYMFVDLPIMTSEEQPINYENDRRTQRYYYFIDGIAQHSPNSTVLVVSPDNWTTFINNIEIPYLMLERGHAPMAYIDVEKYLSNPIDNNEFLLAPDFNFSNGDDLVKTSKFIPINNGEKYILFATTMSAQQVISQEYPDKIENVNTPATFSNIDRRDGYQYQVNDYTWGLGDYNYNGMYTNTTSFQTSNNIIPNGMTMIACKAENADTLFSFMSERIPFFYKTIMACFMVDDTMFDKGVEFEFCNTICYIVQQSTESLLQAIKLKKSDFNFDEKYSNITKLYTFPYSYIEVTDNNGTIKKFKIENTSNIEVRRAVSLAFPFIKIQAYITGINGGGFNEYSWHKINGDIDTLKMYNDDFGNFLWNIDIPTYALYVSGWNSYKATNYPQQYVARYNAIEDYHKSVGMDNTQYENSKDAANNTKAMTLNSSATENTNAVNMANTINTNNIASADTAQANANASANTAKTNTYNVANNNITNTAVDCARNTTVTARNNTASFDSLEQAQQFNATTVRNTNYQNAATTQIENQATQKAAVITGIGNILNGGTNAMQGSSTVDSAANAVNGIVNAVLTGMSCWVTTSANLADTDLSIRCNNGQNSSQRTYNGSLTTISTSCARDNTATNNDAATTITGNTAAMMKTNANNTNTTEKANAQRTNTTSKANANRTKDTSVSNANRTKDNTNTNAELNRSVTIANSDYTRNRAVENAQILLEQKRIANQQQYYTQRLAAPQQYGSYNGDASPDAFERNGLQVKIRTQSKGNIVQCGDLMLRYGYALNQVWDMKEQDLCVMKHFTYWKTADIWINTGTGVNGNAQEDIRSAFENGVTVWNNPDEVGKVSIYDNWNK